MGRIYTPGLDGVLEKVYMNYGSDNASTAEASVEQIQLRIKGLQHEVEKSATMVRRLAMLAGMLVFLLGILLIALHLYHVTQYAEVSRVEATSAIGDPGIAEIVYVPLSAGKIEFVRESDGLVETITEYANDPHSGDKSDGGFSWSGKEGEKSRLHITYREGLFLVTRDLPVKGAGRGN